MWDNQDNAYIKTERTGMNDTTMWWVLAGTLVALELATGTFYLLMLGLGAVAEDNTALLPVGRAETSHL